MKDSIVKQELEEIDIIELDERLDLAIDGILFAADPNSCCNNAGCTCNTVSGCGT